MLAGRVNSDIETPEKVSLRVVETVAVTEVAVTVVDRLVTPELNTRLDTVNWTRAGTETSSMKTVSGPVSGRSLT